MKLAIMQPYFFPYIGYFQCIHAADKYILYENLDYITEGWMHRNRILVKNSQPVYINARLSGKSSNKKISEIALDPSPQWKRKLLNSIQLNYGGSAYFEEVFPLIQNLVNGPHELLFEYNAAIIRGISSFLGIDTEIVSRNSNYLSLEEQLETIDGNNYGSFPHLELTRPIKKVARVLEICAAEKAAVFLNAIGGQELYSKDEFKAYGIDLFFIKTGNIHYPQFSREFYPHLSVIDVLMHNGKQGTKELLNNYELV
jgi:hypothetical protein